MNDLPNQIVDGCSYLYADDTVISVKGQTGTEIENKLKLNLLHLHTWFNQNKLSINLDKSKVMLFGTSHQLQNIGTVSVTHGNCTLEVVSTFCYLGIVLDSRLTFSSHVQHIKSKTFSKIKLLGRVRHILDTNTASMLYKTLILPIFDYLDFVYFGISEKDKEILQRLQNCAFKVILRMDKLTSTTLTHMILEMDTLQERRMKHVATQMYRFTHKECPETCSNMFTPMSEYHGRHTRSAVNLSLAIPKTNLSLGQKNIRYFGVKIWEKIPMDIKMSRSLECFKKAMKTHNLT